MRIKMTKAFYLEWCISEYVDQVRLKDVIDALSVRNQAEAKQLWIASESGEVFDYDLNRLYFTKDMFNAELLTDRAYVEFSPDAQMYVTHAYGLEYHIEKWQTWLKDGNQSARGYVRSGKRILSEVMERESA